MRGPHTDGRLHQASSVVERPLLRDAAIGDALQLNLHYYIAGYGTIATLAARLDREDDARIIGGMRDHMIAKDEEYTKLAQRLGQVSQMENIDAE